MMNTSASGIGASSPYTEAPAALRGGAPRLFQDFLRAPGKLAAYYGPAFDDEPALAALASRLANRKYPRDLLARALDESAAEFTASAAARAQLSLLRRPDSLVVFAGQQAGLFTGPLYAIYKALTVERWAADLSRLLAVPVIPCYWLCNDDHDFAEVDHVNVPCGAQFSTLRYTRTAARFGEPLGRIVLDSSIESVITALAGCLPRSEFTQGAVEAIRTCYAAGAKFCSAYARLWYRMFPDSRLLFVAPDHPSLRELAAPLLERALTDDVRLFSTYAQTSRLLQDMGYHQQVHKTPMQTFLFHQQSGRRGIRHDGGGKFVWEGAEPVSADWLRRALREQPENFSPNVLLRPVVQNALFPTAGVVLGPAETAYYAQIGGLHDHFDVPRPAILPRTSVTIVEQSVAQRLARHEIEATSLCEDLEAEVTRVMRTRFPHDLDRKLQAGARKVEAAFEEIGVDLQGFDSTLIKTVRAAAVRAGRQMNTVASKAHAIHKRREQETQAQIRSVALHLFPRGLPQERTFNIAYYWARYGPALLRDFHQQWPAGRRDPLLWKLQSP